MIERPKYINKLISLRDNGRVKIITGIRRCGKSYLLKELFFKCLKEDGIDDEHYIYLALDDFEKSNLWNPIELNKYIRSLLIDNNKYYVVIDEIQNVYDIINPIFTEGKIIKAKKKDEDSIGFVQIVLGLMKLDNVDLYITGSNSRFLSKDIITDFRDRGDEIHVLPLSFSEFVSEYGDNYENAYEEYSKYGGMPRTLLHSKYEDKEKYLSDLYYLTYKKDVLEHYDKSKFSELDTLTYVIASSIGSLTNPNTIANTFKSVEKIDVSTQTIYSYLEELEDSFLISKVGRYDIRGRKHIGALYKYYFSDLGIRNARLDFMHDDKGHAMENIIYNELVYRGFEVEVGVVEVYSKDSNDKTIRINYETDFIAKKGSRKYYIQSAYDIQNENKYRQETKSLSLINDSFKKILVTRQTMPVTHDNDGITTIGVIEFLLNDDSLDL